MSTLDLYEDGFPHATKEGYERGCRGHGACPGVLEFGRSCNQASIAYSGDYTYRKRVDAGLSAAEIRELEVAESSTPSKKRVSGSGTNLRAGLNEVQHPVQSVTVASSETPVNDADFAADGIALERHGTTSGYSAGCRLKDACPGVERVGISCTGAASAYQRERKARAGRPAEASETSVEAEVTESEIVADGSAELVPDVPTGVRVRADDILTDLADTKAELERVTRQRDGLDDELSARGRLVAELQDQLVQAALALDVEKAKTRDRDIAALASDADSVLRGEWDFPIVLPAERSLTITPTADGGVRVESHGGPELVGLDMEFAGGGLARAVVITGPLSPSTKERRES